MLFKSCLLIAFMAFSTLLYGSKASENTSAIPLSIPDSTITELTELTRDFREKHHIPGILVGIWPNNGDAIILEEGLAEITSALPVRRNNHTRIASITKSFTVLIALQLIQQKKLALDTPISKFYPTMHNSNATIAQLADMTSGLYNYTESSQFVDDFVKNHRKSANPLEYLTIANKNKPYFPAGSDWHYSNTNTLLLGLIIERVTHQKLSTLINKQILKPLGMHDTLYPHSIMIPEPFMHGYTFEPPEDVTMTNPIGTGGSGAMISTLDDLHFWVRALGKGTLVSKELHEQTLQSLKPMRSFPCADTVAERKKASCPDYDRYGMGMGEIAGWIGHTGEFVGYTSLMMYEPQTDSTLVILMNISAPGKHLPSMLFRKYASLLAAGK